MLMTDRQRQILFAIIEEYAELATPVGSVTLAKLFDVSSATIRAEMVKLEEMGYIMQPHTSAGRVPTDAGYRLYVNQLQDKLEQAPDILIANLPYVDPSWEWTSPELTYEPELALYAKNGGLDLIYKLLAQIMERWQSEKKTHVLLLEADPIQHKKIIGEAVSRGFDFVKQDNFILEFKY